MTIATQDELDLLLLDAHAQNDVSQLIRLYESAADISEQEGDIDACCFYLTHAFVFALESGSSRADILNCRLVRHGRASRLKL